MPRHASPRRRRLANALLGGLLCCSAWPAASAVLPAEIDALMALEMADTSVYRAHFPDLPTGRRAAITLHDQLLASHWRQGYLTLALTPAEARRLEGLNFTLSPDLAFMARRNARLQALRDAGTPPLLGRAAAQRQASKASPMSIPGYACYDTVSETFAAAQALATTYPHLAQWIDIGDSWEKSQGLGGSDLMVLKLSHSAVAAPPGGDKPKLFIQAAIHAREYVTAPLALAFAQELLSQHGRDADSTWMLDHHEVHLLLHTNPDGRQRAETGLSWRKNTNTAYCPSNPSLRGADLNRNFGFSWHSTGGQGSSGRACDPTYRGPGASSEPETQAVEAYVRSLWPDRRGPADTDAAPEDTSGLHIDLHSYSELVLWPWGSTAQAAPNGAALQTLGRRFAYLNGYYPTQSIGLYPTDGTSDGPSYGELGVAAYTFELGTSFFQDCNSYTQRIRPDNLAALRYALRVVRAPYLWPAGPDALQLRLSEPKVPRGTPVTVSARLDTRRFSQANGVEPSHRLQRAEAFVGTPPWLPGATALPMSASDGAWGGKVEQVQLTLDTSTLARGRHLVWVRGVSHGGRVGPPSAVFLRVQ